MNRAGLIEWERIDRVALVVDDVDAAAEDFRTIFGIPFFCMDVPDFQLRAGMSDGNLELVGRLAPDRPTTIDGNFAGGRLVSVGFKVPSVPEARAVMHARGIDLYQDTQVETPGGMVECMFTRTDAFGGLPLSFESYPGDSFVAGVDAALYDALPAAPVPRIPMIRPSLVVPDLASAVRDFGEVFGMEFSVVRNDDLGLWLGFSDGGLNLVSAFDHEQAQAIYGDNWAGGVVAAIGFRVDDIEEVRGRLRERGVEAIYDADAVRLRDSTYFGGNFHGLPIAIYQYEGDSFVEAVGAAAPGEYRVELDWGAGGR